MSIPRNLRDVAQGVNQISGQEVLLPGTLYRSGELDGAAPSELPNVKTIISLRRREDPDLGQDVAKISVAPTDSMNN